MISLYLNNKLNLIRCSTSIISFYNRSSLVLVHLIEIRNMLQIKKIPMYWLFWQPYVYVNIKKNVFYNFIKSSKFLNSKFLSLFIKSS